MSLLLPRVNAQETERHIDYPGVWRAAVPLSGRDLRPGGPRQLPRWQPARRQALNAVEASRGVAVATSSQWRGWGGLLLLVDFHRSSRLT